MAKKVTELTVFVAAPSDVYAEIERLQEVIGNLNEIYGEQCGVKLNMVHWRSSTYPAVATDSQAVINEQIGDDYDVFIGILWKSFGQPTPRAPSGTIEEFNRAYRRWEANPDEVRILFYFKEMPPTKLSELDLDSLAKINDFRKSWRDRGLYCTFLDTEEFAKLVQRHLGKLHVDWGKTWGRRVGSSPVPQQQPAVTWPSEPAPVVQRTYMDLFDDYEEHLESATAIVIRLGEDTESLGRDVKQQMSAAQRRLAGARTRSEVEAAVDLVMQPVRGLASTLRHHMPAFVGAHHGARRSLSQATKGLLESYDEADRSELQRVLRTVHSAEQEYSTGLQKLQELVDTMLGFGDQFSSVKRSRRDVFKQLRKMRAEMQGFLESLRSARSVVERVIGQ